MATTTGRLAEHYELPAEVLKNVFVLVSSIQKATRNGSFPSVTSREPVDRERLFDSLIAEYGQKL